MIKRFKYQFTITFEKEEDVSENFTAENLESMWNEGSFCASNLIGELQELDEKYSCLCDLTKVKVEEII